MTEQATRRLIVTWKNEHARRIIPVAELVIDTGGRRFEFGYLDGVREAETEGFQPFLARRATDRIETILVPVPDDAGRYVTHFLVRGVQYARGSEPAIAGLRPRHPLRCSIDEKNGYNPRARQLQADGVTIGHIPDYLVADIDALERAGAAPAVYVERVNPPPHPVHYRVLCRIESEWPEGFVPFSDKLWLAPYVARAAA